VYDGLEDLAMMGMTEIIGLNTRPISRMAAAHRIVNMIEDVQDEKLNFSILRDEKAVERAERLLYRLMDEFEQELVLLGVDVVLREDRPPKKITHEYVEHFEAEFIYAGFDDSNTKSVKLDNRRGWTVGEEANGRVSARSWINFMNTIDLSAEPAIYISKDQSKITLDEAFAGASYKNIECGIGRTSMWWSPGRHGAMLLSNNTRPLYLAKAGNTRPFRLPYIEELGLWNINFFTSKLKDEESGVVKEPYLSGVRVEFSPHKRLNFGGTHTIMWGGEGARDVSFTDFLDMFFTKLGGGADEDENHLISFTAEWTVPGVNAVFPVADGALVYLEIGAEDESNGVPSHIGGLGGVKVIDLFLVEGLDAVLEYAKTDNVWYKHHLYTDGYSFRDYTLGHHVGSGGDDIFISLHRQFERFLSINAWLDVERHGLEQSVIEKRYEAGADLTFRYMDFADVTVEYTFQYYDEFDNVIGQTTKNHIVSLSGKMEF